MNKTLVCLLLCFVNCIARGQHGELYKSLKSKFNDDPAVFVERSEVLSLVVKGDSLEIVADISEDILHLKEQVDAFASGRVYGSHFSQVKDIKAKTLIWDKSKFREMSVSDFKKNSDRDAGIFYDDSYYYSFNYPSVAEGNRTQLQYRSIVKDARFIPGYIFSTYLPQSKVSYTIKTTKQVDLVYNVLNDPKNLIKFRKYEKSGFTFYEWTSTDMAARRAEDGSPSIRYYAPHVVCYVKSFEGKSGKKNILANLDDLYRWYYGFVANLNQDNNPELQAIADKIKSQNKSEADIVRAVFYWVQDNIQYVAFEEGMRGLIPRDGAYVCAKRYGDCKDMANLVVALLKASGIKAYHTWIGTRDLPYKYSELPTPLVDNHMIATYIDKNNNYYFLDATSDHTPFGMPSAMIQGKEAMIGYSKDKYEVRVVPAIAKEVNEVVDSTFVSVDQSQTNQLNGMGSIRLSGYAKVFGAYELDRSEREDVKRYVTKLIGKGNNKFYLDKYSVSNLTDRDKPTLITYSFRIGDYFQKIGDELYINLNLNKDFYNESINSSMRKTPRQSEYKYERTEYCDLLIPSGYTLDYIPPDAKIVNELVGLEVTYNQNGEHISLMKRIYSNFLLMMPEDFESWNTAIKDLSEAYKESIILKKK